MRPSVECAAGPRRKEGSEKGGKDMHVRRFGAGQFLPEKYYGLEQGNSETLAADEFRARHWIGMHWI